MVQPAEPHKPSFTWMEAATQQGVVLGKAHGSALSMLAVTAIACLGQTHTNARKIPNCKFSDVKGGIALTALFVALTVTYYLSLNKLIMYSMNSFTKDLEEQGTLKIGKPLGYKHLKVFFSSWCWTLTNHNEARSVFDSLSNLQKHFLKEILSEKQFTKLGGPCAPTCGNLTIKETLQFCLVDEIWSKLSKEDKEKHADKLTGFHLYILRKNIGDDEFRKSVGAQNQTNERYFEFHVHLQSLVNDDKLLESLPTKALANILLDAAVYQRENYDQELKKLKNFRSILGTERDKELIDNLGVRRSQAEKNQNELIQKITKILCDHPPSQEEFSNALFASGEFKLEDLPALWDVLHRNAFSTDGDVIEKPTLDEFALLEIKEGDNLKNLRKNFLRLSLILHPDKNTSDPSGDLYKEFKNTHEKLQNWMQNSQIESGSNPLQAAVDAILEYVLKNKAAINKNNPWDENCPTEVQNILKDKPQLTAV